MAVGGDGLLKMKLAVRAGKKLAALVAIGMLAATNSVAAESTHYIYYNGKTVAKLHILTDTEAAGSALVDAGKTYFDMTSESKLATGITSATAYWTNMLGAGNKSPQPWAIAVVGLNDYKNASASPRSYNEDGEYQTLNYVKEAIQNGKKLTNIEDFTANPLTWTDGDTGFSFIRIGRYFGAEREGATSGYWVDTDTLLPTNEQSADFLGCFRHELGHALGILAEYEDYKGGTENTLLGEDTLPKLISLDTNDWSSHLIDQNGNALDKDKLVITSEQFATLKAADSSLEESDYFIVDYVPQDNSTAGKPYFVGKNVTEALDGKTFDGVSGLPVNGWEGRTGNYNFEGSHLQTTGMMSHRRYSNYTTFMEVELAAMQDIGYTIDRKAYYGKSIYKDGQTITNTQGYSARNADGTAYLAGEYSTVPLGVGLHIYGSDNTVTQAADILTNGTGAAGVRVDGTGNMLTIDSGVTVAANGKNGRGIMVAYGRDHTVNIDGTVTASGQDGRAVALDFGSSSNGALDEYRGSYIRFQREVDETSGDISNSYNIYLTEMDSTTYNNNAEELDGALVKELNVNGTIAGGESAIYIGKNAFVDTININKGASIKGAITSEWKQFAVADKSYDAVTGGSSLKIQYKDASGNACNYDYTDYIPDLVTDLNINADLTYSGTISGADNMMLNVTDGTFNYSGAADVVNVTVADGATVVGGTYTVNDMSGYEAESYEAATANTGKFTNHGTIRASSADSNLTINGTLVSDGAIVGIAGGKGGAVSVNGAADVTGSTVSVENALPDESVTVVAATDGISGDFTTARGKGWLDYYGTIDDGALTINAVDNKANLGTMSAREEAGHEILADMRAALRGDSRADELRPLYAMDAAPAKRELGRLATNELPGDMAASAQRSHLTNRLVASRLHNLWKTQAVTTVPSIASKFGASGVSGAPSAATWYGTGFARNVILNQPAQETTLTTSGALAPGSVTLRTALPAVDTNTWVNIEKNWGELQGGANYHGQAISAGYDWQSGKNSRAGVFVSYRASSLAADAANANLYDTRVGYYTGSTHGAIERSLYADIGWQYGKTARYVYTGLTASGKESSNIYELGGRIGYDLHHDDGKVWHVVPYIAAQGSWLKSKGYNETGASIWNQQVASDTSRYFGTQLGVTFERAIRNGSLTLDLGLRHAFSGGELYRSYRYEGNTGRSYTMSSSQDKTHGLLSLTADTEFARGWHISANSTLEKGAHDRDLAASIALKRMW